ncbi:MAG TPA: helix-turn-helix domain-containing protein [Acidimicrobiales bacterium]|nr:helix-turn-helix domain-containing protein [Acidimicrobiales bacterium]
MTIDSHTSEAAAAATTTSVGSRGATPGEGSATRRRILQIALTLMAQRGVDGTSMRDLASAAGLNVASLYHYFPSKRDLLEEVLVEHGFLPVHTPRPDPREYENIDSPLAQLLADILVSMFEVEDFVRLMVGEAIRAETTARTVGLDLYRSFQTSIEDWIVKHRPDLAEPDGPGPISRMLSAMVVGIFVQHASGAISEESGDLVALSLRRAREAAEILRPPT